MVDYTRIASYDVRQAILTELKSHGYFKTQDYMADGLTLPLEPMIPAQQIPEFINLLPGKPFIVYDVVQKIRSVQWWILEDSMTLEIASTNAKDIQTMINILIDLLRRYDQSANDINLNLATTSPFKFHFFHIDSTDPVQSFQNEGGLMSGVLTFSYSYSREVDSNTGRYI